MPLRYDIQNPNGLLYDEQTALEGGGVFQSLTGIGITVQQGSLNDAISTSTDLSNLDVTFAINAVTASVPAVSPQLVGQPISMVPGFVGATGDGEATTALTGLSMALEQGTFDDFSYEIQLESQPITYQQGSITASNSDGLSTNITQALSISPITVGIGTLNAGTQVAQTQALTSLPIGFTQGALTASGQGAPLLDRVVVKARTRSITITERR